MTPRSIPISAGLKKKIFKYPPVTSLKESELPSQSQLMTSPLDLPGLARSEVNVASPPTPYSTSELNFPLIKSQVGSPRPPSIPRPDGPLLLRQRMQSVLYRTNMKRKEMQARKSLKDNLSMGLMANSLRHGQAITTGTSKESRGINEGGKTQESLKLRPRSHQVTKQAYSCIINNKVSTPISSDLTENVLSCIAMQPVHGATYSTVVL